MLPSNSSETFFRSIKNTNYLLLVVVLSGEDGDGHFLFVDVSDGLGVLVVSVKVVVDVGHEHVPVVLEVHWVGSVVKGGSEFLVSDTRG